MIKLDAQAGKVVLEGPAPSSDILDKLQESGVHLF